jgi:hypothetical protein
MNSTDYFRIAENLAIVILIPAKLDLPIIHAGLT